MATTAPLFAVVAPPRSFGGRSSVLLGRGRSSRRRAACAGYRRGVAQPRPRGDAINDEQATGPSDAAPASPPPPPPDTSWYAAAAAIDSGPDIPPGGGNEPHRALAFGEAVGACLRQYATFSGRAQRSEYWWWALFNLLVFVALGLSGGVVGADATAVDVIAVIVVFALLLPNLAVTVRRLHDIDRSGWWVLIGVVPVVGSIILLVFAMLPGTPGGNRFGPTPMPPPLA